MNLDPRQRELIDLCRAGYEDWKDVDFPEPLASDDPEVAQALHNSTSLDFRIRAAMDDVQLPDGLEQRLLENLTAANPTSQHSRFRSFGSKGLWFAIVAVAATVAIWLGSPTQKLPEEVIWEDFSELMVTEVESDSQWNDRSRTPPQKFTAPGNFPQYTRWRSVTLGNIKAVVFDIGKPGSGAFVISFPANLPGNTAFGNNPSFTTRGYCYSYSFSAAEKVAHLVLVKGDKWDYLRFIPRNIQASRRVHRLAPA